MATWPASLPQSFQIDSLREEPGENTIESVVEMGPKKTRQRFSAVEKPISGTMQMTLAQYATFKEFFDTTIQAGSQKFDMPDPHGSTMSVRFAGQKYTASFSYPFWVLNLELVRLPT